MALIECTTLARVKAILGKKTTPVTPEEIADDAYLEELIEAVSQRIEDFIDRRIEAAARTVELDVHSVGQRTLFLPDYPVTAIASVKASLNWDWAATTALDATLYHLVAETGEIHLRTTLQPGLKSVQVVYTAGLAADTATLIADYPAIANAADKQCVAEWRRRSSPQGQSINAGGGSITHEAELQLLKDVRQTLSPYRRLRFGA